MRKFEINGPNLGGGRRPPLKRVSVFFNANPYTHIPLRPLAFFPTPIPYMHIPLLPLASSYIYSKKLGHFSL